MGIPSRKVLADTRTISHDEWLELRRKGIGGSDAGAIIGMNPWASPYTVWLDKLGRLPAKEDNEAMRVGRDLEPYVAERFCEATGKKVARRNNIFQHPQYDFMLANIDRQVVGENAGLECKTAKAFNLKRFKGQYFPDQYYAQCVHYMAVMGYDRMYLAVLIMGSEFKVYTLERDEEEIELLIGEEKRFWNDYVVTEQAPPLDGSEASSEALKTIYEGGGTEEIMLFGRERTLKEYYRLKEKKKVLDSQISAIENQLKEDLGDNERGSCEGYRVDWKAQSRTSFDYKRFQSDHPDMDLSEYYKTSQYRVFKIKEVKKEED